MSYLPDKLKMLEVGYHPFFGSDPGANEIYLQSMEPLMDPSLDLLIQPGVRKIRVVYTDNMVCLTDIDDSGFEFVLPDEAFFDQLLTATGFNRGLTK